MFSVTCIDALTYTPTINALKKTLETLKSRIHVNRVHWFSDIPLKEDVGCDVQWTEIDRFQKYTEEYNYITLQLIPKVVEEDYNLIIHADGFAVNPDAWDDEFLRYDYIGARWNNGLVGNGGFSLRSRKLYDALIQLKVPYKTEDFPRHIVDDPQNYVYDSFGEKVIPEDNIICKIYRAVLSSHYGISFPSSDIVEKFSIEHNMQSPWLGKSLGFHGKHGVATHYGVQL